MPVVLTLPDEAATLRAGCALASGLGSGGGVIALYGELGAGKTTLVRGLLAKLGHPGRVKSPSYTLLEPYELQGRTVYHLDLYRITSPEELPYLGLSDLDPDRDLLLIEWAERGGALLPVTDLTVELDYAGPGRVLRLDTRSPRAQAWLAAARTALEALKAEDKASFSGKV